MHGGETWREGQVPAECEAHGPQRRRRNNLLGDANGLDFGGWGDLPPRHRPAGATLRAGYLIVSGRPPELDSSPAMPLTDTASRKFATLTVR